MHELGLLGKLDLIQKTLANWPLIFADKGGLRRECLYRLREGGQMLCRSRSSDVDAVVALVSGYEYPDFALRLRRNATVIDGGANIGAFIARLMQLNAEHVETISVHAFEPHPENFAQLRRNIELNGWRVRATQTALAGRSGERSLHNSSRADSAYLVDTGGDFRVSAVSLSEYLEGCGVVDLLKLDVEGAEYELFTNAYEAITSSVRRIVLEYHGAWGCPDVRALLDRVAHDFDTDVVWRRRENGVLLLTNRRRG